MTNSNLEVMLQTRLRNQIFLYCNTRHKGQCVLQVFVFLVFPSPDRGKRDFVVRTVKTDFSGAFCTNYVEKRVFSYVDNRFCGSADRVAQVKALMHSTAFLAGRSQKREGVVLVIIARNPLCKLGLSWRSSKRTGKFLPTWEPLRI